MFEQSEQVVLEKKLYLGVKQSEAVPHTTSDGEEGYLVELEDDHGLRFYPKNEFESVYTPIDHAMTVSFTDLWTLVASVQYKRIDNKTILCTLTLKTGFVVYGLSSCTTPDTVDDYGVGVQNAKENAVTQLRNLMSFCMQWGRNHISNPGREPVEIDLTDMLPMV